MKRETPSDPASTTTQTVTTWPGVATLRERCAVNAARTAEKLQEDTGWSNKKTSREVRAIATEAALNIALALVEAAEMGLDVWATTQPGGSYEQ